MGIFTEWFDMLFGIRGNRTLDYPRDIPPPPPPPPYIAGLDPSEATITGLPKAMTVDGLKRARVLLGPTPDLPEKHISGSFAPPQKVDYCQHCGAKLKPTIIDGHEQPLGVFTYTDEDRAEANHNTDKFQHGTFEERRGKE